MSAERRGRGFRRLSLFYAAIPVLAAVSDAYEVVTHALEQQQVVNWLTICIYEIMPRLGLGLILAFAIYGLFRVGGSALVRLDRVCLAATDGAWTLYCGRQSG